MKGSAWTADHLVSLDKPQGYNDETRKATDMLHDLFNGFMEDNSNHGEYSQVV